MLHFKERADVGNVVRFPIERRATLELLRHIAPDVREISLLADTYDLAVPADLEARADQAAAEFILNQVPASGPERATMLREMLAEALADAFAAVRVSEHAAYAARDARERHATYKDTEYTYTAADIAHQAAERSLAAAEALITAQGRALEAYGVARVVDLACRGEPWTPRNVHAEMDWLIEAEAARRVR